MDGSSLDGSGAINGSNNNATGMSRAERFEDEKRRIIESCFAKVDPDGALQESYITHIRITEDGAYQSSPPPPNSNPDQKKQRLIIIAVRKSGRVRMHKARENANGTYSIGKTWPLDDLSAIESFSGLAPKNAEEEQRKQWAGGVGFIVTIGKPYYWQANTQKEKQFFIGSLAKIYTKYTGGKAPELIGFDDREREQLLGTASASQRPQPLNRSVQPSGQRASPASNAPLSTHGRPMPPRQIAESREPFARQEVAASPHPRGPMSRQKSSEDQIPRSQVSTPPFSASRPPTSSSQTQVAREYFEAGPGTGTGNQRQQAPLSLRKVAADNQSQESVASRDDGRSPSPRSRGGLNGMSNVSGRFQDRSATPASQRALTPDSNVTSRQDAPSEMPPVPAPLAFPPERRRPPLQVSPDRVHSREQSEDMVPAPLATPSQQREFKLPARSTERPEPPQPLRVNNAATGNANQNARPETAVVLGHDQKPSDAVADDDRAEASETKATVLTSVPSQLPGVSEKVRTPAEPSEDERPGLGPMIKKKSKADVAAAFRKAASAASVANAFKPRAGGAAERLREQQTKTSEGPDGITSVVPAPSLLRGISNGNTRTGTPEQVSQEKPSISTTNETIPEVKITVPSGQKEVPGQKPPEAIPKLAMPEKKSREVKRQKPTSEITQKQLASLGIDSSLLDGRGAQFATLLDNFGWAGEGIHTKSIDQINDEIERELNKAQIGGWFGRLEEEDDRVEAIKQGLDVTIAECEELDGLLTLYGVELGTLNEDIAYIEAQSQGLQVQAANQKLLQAELKSLLETISISSSQLQSLKESSLESSQGLEQIEASLVLLFKAMVTIDPNLSLSAPRTSEDDSVRSGKFENSEIGSMRVLQEKKEMYKNESALFLRRLKQFLHVKFGAAVDECKKALERTKESNLNRRTGKTKLDPRNHDLTRNFLVKYSPLMLFLREVDRSEWEDFMKSYESTSKPVYQEEIRDAVAAWQRLGRKPTGDEHEILFTSQIEKQAEGIATTARKLTVKRSQTLAKSLRSPLGDNASRTAADKIQDGRLFRYEVFGNILDDTVPLIIIEQNFLVDFFHVSSFEEQDFPESVSAAPPDARYVGDLKKLKLMDPNRNLAKIVLAAMDEMYSFLPGDLQQLIEWALRDDPLQGVGVIAVIQRKLLEIEESNQEFLARTLHKVHSNLGGLFVKFLDEQIRAIEDTKVKIKKRKGVIAFIRIFPIFSLAVENMLASADDLDIRETVNNAYHRINKTMFESLKVIARENTGILESGAGGIGAGLENKEELNHQILLIENMNHYLEEVDARRNPVLEEWKEKAAQEFDENLSKYIAAVMSRPLKHLLLFLDSIETSMLTLAEGVPRSTIAQNSRQSKMAFQQVLAEHDSKYVRNGIAALKKRVEKHFGDADDPGLSRALVAKVLEACERYFYDVDERVRTISSDVYDGVPTIEWTKNDISSSFR